MLEINARQVFTTIDKLQITLATSVVSDIIETYKQGEHYEKPRRIQMVIQKHRGYV